MRKITVAATQMNCSWNIDANIAAAERLVEAAYGKGAVIVLLQELFATPYFCQKQKPEYLKLASEVETSMVVQHFQTVARKLGVVLPVSFFERRNNARYNSIATIDADGSLLGVYRKTHIPDGPGYQEKYYFNPGDTGFRVWNTRYGRIGIGICWDQWFPEAARSMALLGAELLLYPTAIGSEPGDATVDSQPHWQRTMQGHAAANIVPVIAANRVGTEQIDDSAITFYGSSFITGYTGEILAAADQSSPTVITTELDLAAAADYRQYWGVYRDRRPSLYHTLLTSDGG
jgi:N-carbamoylputrescine amidase